MGPSDAAADPLGGALFAEVVRTHIPRAWAVDDDEDYADAEVRRGDRWLDAFVGAGAIAAGVVEIVICFATDVSNCSLPWRHGRFSTKADLCSILCEL